MADELTPPPEGVQSFGEFRRSGLLWLLNTAVLHPRGFAIAFCWPGPDAANDPIAEPIGWKLLGDGSEPWAFGDDTKRAFAAVKVLLKGDKP